MAIVHSIKASIDPNSNIFHWFLLIFMLYFRHVLAADHAVSPWFELGKNLPRKRNQIIILMEVTNDNWISSSNQILISIQEFLHWESFTFVYIMAAFTLFGISILQTIVETCLEWQNQVESLKEVLALFPFFYWFPFSSLETKVTGHPNSNVVGKSHIATCYTEYFKSFINT